MDTELIVKIVVFLLIGGASGWLAGRILKGRGLGLIGNLLAGIIGSYLGAWIFDLLGFSVGGEWIGQIVTATVGALVLIFVFGIFRPVRR